VTRKAPKPVTLSLDEARGAMLAAQGLAAPPSAPDRAALRAMIERLGVVQVDTISVIERSQYLVLWSRLGAYPMADFDALLHPARAIFECWCHVASIVPMADYAYHRARLRGATEHLWGGDQEWLRERGPALKRTLALIRERGPMASADFEKLEGEERGGAWDWYGGKESRRALQILWTLGELMVHSRRGGQKVYDLPERVLGEVFGEPIPRGRALPSAEQRLRHFTRRTTAALGLTTPSWLCDYYRLGTRDGIAGGKRAAAAELLAAEAARGQLVPAVVEGLKEPAYLTPEALAEVERLRAGATPQRTTLLSPFDSLIWDRARARALWGYEVVLEIYVPPEKRRYGYYCLAILHQGRLVGRLDAKTHRAQRLLAVNAVYLDDGVRADEALLAGLAGALGDLARFVGAESVTVERSEPAPLAPALGERLAGPIAPLNPPAVVDELDAE
jgi:uncharacterized protein YcaQ